MPFEISMLGPLVLTSGRRTYDVGSARFRTLLALLALMSGTPLSSDQLVNELWPDGDIRNARNALQANIVRLRRRLEQVTGMPGDDLIRTTSVGYLLDVDTECVDVYRFLVLADRGMAACRSEQKLELLESALRIWRGPALFDVVGGPRCEGEATRLDERRLAVREDLITVKLDVGMERAVVPELRQLVAEHPERERFSEQLIVALYRAGRQAEAVEAFHSARRWLDTELGLQPGHSLRRLYHSILRQDQLLPS